MAGAGVAAATSAAVSVSGSLLAWGDNHNGQLGDGGTASSDTPVAVRLGGTTVISVRAGGKYSLALTQRAGCWRGEPTSAGSWVTARRPAVTPRSG